jgi:hypothetical protein
MADLQLTLTDEERKFLVDLVNWVQRETLVEEHRTDSLRYREIVRHREQVIAGLLNKLR